MPLEDKDDPVAQDLPNAGVGPVPPERQARAAMMQDDSPLNGVVAHGTDLKETDNGAR
jgi:hypothetical protein